MSASRRPFRLGHLVSGDSSRGLVRIDAPLPGGVESATHDVFGCLVEPYVRDAARAPSARDGQKYVRQLGDKIALLLGREHHVAVTFRNRRKGRENAPTDAKVDRAHVGTLFGAWKAQREATKDGGCHDLRLPV